MNPTNVMDRKSTRWQKTAQIDVWLLLEDGMTTPLGKVERVGLKYEARDRMGNRLSVYSSPQLAMGAVERAERVK